MLSSDEANTTVHTIGTRPLGCQSGYKGLVLVDPAFGGDYSLLTFIGRYEDYAT